MARLSFVTGLLGLAGALHLDPAIPVQLARSEDEEAHCKPFRQQLTNQQDLQYWTEITVGGQRLTGILDTGSFELIVFSSKCFTCGKAGAYNENRSPTFKRGRNIKEHAFGSGACRSRDATDEVKLGCYSMPKQSIWLAMECRMPVLAEAGFQSIVGVGPPGQPEFTAREAIRQLNEMKQTGPHQYGVSSEELQEAMDHAKEELKVAVEKPSLLEGFGMRTFSTCYSRQQGGPGWLIWDDDTREGLPGVIKVPVTGNITWGIALGGLSLELLPSADTDVSAKVELPIGCERGCGAVIDTGTSLLSVPSSTYRAIVANLEQHITASDCSDLRNFPTLIISVAGQKLRLPPSSYVGQVRGVPTAPVAQFLHLSKQPYGDQACELLIMDIGNEMTQFGPLVILGMPLFREYYTTFDLGSGRGHRSIYLSPADEACEPEVGKQVKYNMNRAAFAPRVVNVSMVRPPEWLHRRSGITV